MLQPGAVSVCDQVAAGVFLSGPASGTESGAQKMRNCSLNEKVWFPKKSRGRQIGHNKFGDFQKENQHGHQGITSGSLNIQVPDLIL